MSTTSISDKESRFADALEGCRGLILVRVRRIVSSRGWEGDFREITEDITQQTICNAWRGRASYRDSVPLHAWICGVASNACADHYRKAKPVEPLDAYSDEIAEIVDDTPCIVTKLLEDEQSKVLINQAILIAMAINSPPMRRMALLLAAGVSVAEIAKMRGVPKAAVSRSLHKLRRILENERSRRDSESPQRVPSAGDACSAA